MAAATPIRTTDRDTVARGLALMLVAVAFFAVTDASAKLLAERVHPIMVVWSRFAVHVLFLVPLLAWTQKAGALRSAVPRLQAARGVLLLVSTTAITLVIAEIDLAQLTALTFVAPLIAVVLSVPILGERVGVRRWSAVAVGFLGMVLIVRPGLAGWNPYALVVSLGAMSWALGFVLTRRIGGADPPLVTLAWTTAVGVGGSSLVLPLVWTWPDGPTLALLLFNGAINFLAQYLSIRAAQLASPGAMAPLIYTNLLWAALFGWLLFDAVPDLWTLAGAAIIVGAGLYVWGRERALARR